MNTPVQQCAAHSLPARALVHGRALRRRQQHAGLSLRKAAPPGTPAEAQPAWERELRRLCAQGNKWDARIAEVLVEVTGQRWTRQAVAYWRARLGLPGQRGVASRRLRWQLKRTNGVKSLQGQRYEVHRVFQGHRGWPEDLVIDTHVYADGRPVLSVYLGALAPREVQLLDLLWEASATSVRRAWTRRELAVALAEQSAAPWRAAGARVRRRPPGLRGGQHDPLTDLLARGLVVRVGRRRVGRCALQALYAIRPGLHPYVPETQRPRTMELAAWNPLRPCRSGSGESASNGDTLDSGAGAGAGAVALEAD